MLVPLRNKIGDYVQQVVALRPKPGGAANTLNANIAAGGTTATLVSATGFDANDPILIGSEEDAELVSQSGAAAGANITLRAPGSKRAHVTGEAVTELEAYDLGNVVGVMRGDAATVQDLNTDVDRNPDGVVLGHLTRQPQFDVQGYTPWAFALLTGMPLSRVLGAGSAADPTQLHTDGSDFGSVPTGIVMAERLADGSFLRHEYDSCDADYSQMVIPFGQGRETRLAGRFVARNHGQSHSALIPFTINYAQQLRNAHQIESLLEVAWLRPLSGGLSTTLTSQTNKDANVFNLAVATGVAGGKYYLVTGNGRQQVILAQSLATLAMTCRTRAAYDFPAGSTVVELEVLSLGGLKEGTTEFSNGGSVRPVRFDNARVQAGLLPGAAQFTGKFQPTARTLEMLRLANGLPAAAISGTALTESDLVGTDFPVGFYIRGQQKNTKTVQIIGSGVTNALEQLQQMLSKNELPATPLALRARLQSHLNW